MVLLDEVCSEKTLPLLQAALLEAFDIVVNHPHNQLNQLSVMTYFNEYSLHRYRDKTVSLAFYRERSELKEEKLPDDDTRALMEILTQRLGVKRVIFDRRSSESTVDFYIIEETMKNNVNDKRRLLRQRRDVMSHVKTQAKK